MIHNILNKRSTLIAAVAVMVVVAAFAVAAQAGHDKDTHHKKGSWTVLTEMEGKGFLGVQMQELTDDIREGLGVDAEYGVLISTVIKDSPAEKAGLEEGDIVTRFNGKRVESAEELREMVAETEVGDEVKIELLRDDEEETLTVTIGEWPDTYGFSMGDFNFDRFDWEDMPQFVHALMPRRLGVSVQNMNDDLAEYFGVDPDEGLLVLSVSEESMAEEMGIKSGDVITEVAGEQIDSAGDIRRALHEVEEGEAFEVTVVRQKKSMTLEGEMHEDRTSDRVRNAFRWQGSPRMHIDHDHDEAEIRKELDELRDEIEELKKELKKSQRR